MALFRATVNQVGLRFGQTADLDPENPSVARRVLNGALMPVGQPDPVEVEEVVEAPVEDVAPVSRRRKARSQRENDPEPEVEGDVFADPAVTNTEPQVEVEGLGDEPADS